MRSRILCFVVVAGLVCVSADASTDQWIEVRSDHFTVISDASQKQTLHILDQFERMRWMFQTLFPKANVDPADPIVVLAAKNQKTFDSMEPAAYLAKGQMKLGGLFLRTADRNYVLLNLEASFEHPFAAVYHEYTHLQFEASSVWMPLWLNEGLAEFIQNTEIRDKDVLIGEPSADDILYLRRTPLIPLAVLFKVDQKSPYYHEEHKGSVFYAESWAMTHYLEVTDRENKTERLKNYTDLVKQGEDSDVAAEKAFGNLKKLQEDLQSYIQAGSYKQFVLSSAAAPINESSYKVRALKQTDADAVRADVLAGVDREAEARTILDAVLKADPKNVQALETRGSLEFRAGNIVAARDWYEQAVKLDSQDYLAHYYFASMSMELPYKGQDEQIEASLRAAMRLNPRFAPAYDRLAVFFAKRREHLDEALTLESQAVGWDPANVVYRLNAANLLMTMGRNENAIIVLQNAEKVAKDPANQARVESMIANVEQYQAAQTQAEARAKANVDANGHPRVQDVQEPVAVESTPKHPTERPSGPKHTVEGVIRNVQCSYPEVLEFSVVNAKATYSVYNNDFSKIDLSVVGFTPKGAMNPCADFEGMKARVKYVESSDKTVSGQVVAVVLEK